MHRGTHDKLNCRLAATLNIRMAEPGDHTFIILGLTFGRDDAVLDDHTRGTRRLGLCRKLAHVRVCATVVWGHSASAVAAAGSTRSPASSAPGPHL